MTNLLERNFNPTVKSLDIPKGCEPRCRGCFYRSRLAPQEHIEKVDQALAELHPWFDSFRGSWQSPQRWANRTRAVLVAHRTPKADQSEWLFGFKNVIRKPTEIKAEKKVIEWIDLEKCPAHSLEIQKLLPNLKTLLSTVSIPIVYVVINRDLVTFVIKQARNLESLNQLRSLNWSLLEQTGILVDFHPSAGNRIFSSQKPELIWGTDSSSVDILETPFQFGPTSFLQNHVELYEAALRDTFEESDDYLNGALWLDLFCGIGVTSQLALRLGARECLGIDCSEAASFYYPINTSNQNANFLRGQIRDRIPQIESRLKNWTGPIVAYVNPSRDGLDRETVSLLGQLKTQTRLIYQSCNLRSLKDNLNDLESNGFKVQKFSIYDFFPNTRHLEFQVTLVKER